MHAQITVCFRIYLYIECVYVYTDVCIYIHICVYIYVLYWINAYNPSWYWLYPSASPTKKWQHTPVGDAELAGHAVHAPAPGASLYLPASHAVHVPPLGPVYPVLHAQSPLASLAAFMCTQMMHTHTFTHADTHSWENLCLCTCRYMFMYIYIHLHMYINVYIYTCMCLCVYVSMYVYDWGIYTYDMYT
jgi:hypothetical protein